jgi:hypothetical protein
MSEPLDTSVHRLALCRATVVSVPVLVATCRVTPHVTEMAVGCTRAIVTMVSCHDTESYRAPRVLRVYE